MEQRKSFYSSSCIRKKFFIFFTCSLFYIFPQAQIVKFIKNPYQAKYRVYISKNPDESSHWVYIVKSPSEITRGGEWFIVKNPQLFSNATTLYKVDKINNADLVVYFVSKKDSAQIRKSKFF